MPGNSKDAHCKGSEMPPKFPSSTCTFLGPARPWLSCLLKGVARARAKRSPRSSPLSGGRGWLNADWALCFVPILLIPKQQKCCSAIWSAPLCSCHKVLSPGAALAPWPHPFCTGPHPVRLPRPRGKAWGSKSSLKIYASMVLGLQP